MKIHYINIKEYKNIKDFELYLDHNISLFIGKNGSGKSNLLEAIAKIFIDLYKGRNPSFNFTIRYQIEDRFYEIDGKDKATIRPPHEAFQGKSRVNVVECNDDFSHIKSVLNVHDKKVINNSFLNIDEAARSILPTQIVASYTGGSIRLRKLGWGIDKTKRSFIYFQFKDYQKILLTLFSYNIERYQNILEGLGISEFIETSIKTSDKGFVAILEQISEKNLKRINNKKIECTIKGAEQINKIREFFGNEKNFFDYLKYDPSINITNIKIKLTNGLEISDIDLSEGQKHKIGIIGLIEFLQGYENLFLFDEPDNFFHPNWQREIIGDIENLITPSGGGIGLASIGTQSIGGDLSDIKSHIFIATHSPLLLGSSDQLDICGLNFNDKIGKEAILCTTNQELNGGKQIDVFGNRAEFIYKEVFGLEDTRAKDLYEKAKLLHDIIQKDNTSGIEKNQIDEIRVEIKNRLKDDINDELLSYLDLDDIFDILKSKHEEN